MRTFARCLAVGLAITMLAPVPAPAQSAASAELEQLRQELRRLQDRLQKLEQSQQTAPVAPAPPAVPVAAQTPPPVAPRPGEREVQLEREHLFESIGFPKPEIAGAKISGFISSSFSYNSGLQIVPDAFGGAPALTDPQRTSFTFNKFGLGVSKAFASWLSASAAVEIENHRDRHSHIITDGTRRCPRPRECERFGAEAASTEVNLDKADLTVVAPLGNGLRLSLGRFDVPFGIERHDDNVLLTATTSEIFRYGRPQKMTGLQAAYTFAPWLDVAGWIVNRWESEDSGDGDFNDLDPGKSVGGRIGVTPFATDTLLNFGLGGWYGSARTTSLERSQTATDRHRDRWLIDVDATWSPTPRLFFAGEAISGGEVQPQRQPPVGEPVRERAQVDADVNWAGFYLLGHYDFVKWAGLTFRYGLLDDPDRGRTGVSQTLHSLTFTPVLHLSALIPDLRPMGLTAPRTRHPFHWVDLKLEYRLNLSDRAVFGEAQPGRSLHDRASDHSHQIQLQAIVNF